VPIVLAITARRSCCRCCDCSVVVTGARTGVLTAESVLLKTRSKAKPMKRQEIELVSTLESEHWCRPLLGRGGINRIIGARLALHHQNTCIPPSSPARRRVHADDRNCSSTRPDPVFPRQHGVLTDDGAEQESRGDQQKHSRDQRQQRRHQGV